MDLQWNLNFAARTKCTLLILSANLHVLMYTKNYSIAHFRLICKHFAILYSNLLCLTARENNLLRRILRLKKNENEEWKKCHNEEVYSLYSSSSKVIKYKRFKWTGHIARMELLRVLSEFLQVNF